MALIKGKNRQSGKVKHPANCEQLEEQMASPDVAVRREAIREILACPDAARLLAHHLKQELDPSARELVIAGLARLNDATAVAELVEGLRSEDPSLRNLVIDTLKELSVDVSPVLRSLLDDPDADLRIFAVNILESRRHPDVERWLIEVIERDAHVNVCATALDLLCEVGTEASLQPLLQLKTRFAGEAYIQFAADLALKRIRAH